MLVLSNCSYGHSYLHSFSAKEDGLVIFCSKATRDDVTIFSLENDNLSIKEKGTRIVLKL